MHPAIKEDQEFMLSLVNKAREFLLESGIDLDSDQYRIYLNALANEEEISKAVVFAKHLFPNEDYPQGMTEQDVKPEYLQDYPFIAAVGVIENVKATSKNLPHCLAG